MFVFRGRQGDLIKIIWWVSHGRAIGPSDHGARGGMSVLEAAGEGSVCLAARKGGQDRADPGAVGDAAGRDEEDKKTVRGTVFSTQVALAAAHLAAFDGRIKPRFCGLRIPVKPRIRYDPDMLDVTKSLPEDAAELRAFTALLLAEVKSQAVLIEKL